MVDSKRGFMEAPGLYANRNRYGDFVRNAIQKLTATPSNVYIAVAFLTEANVVDRSGGEGTRRHAGPGANAQQ